MMFRIVSTTVLALLVSVSVQAAPVLIDFASGAFDAANGRTDVTIGGIRIRSTGGPLSVNRIGGPGENQDDGLGVGDDEITGRKGQSIRIDFVNGPVNVSKLFLRDLFPGEQPGGERGFVRINTTGNDATLRFGPGNKNGDLLLSNFSFNNVTSLVFRANNDHVSDYSIRSFKIDRAADVPEPATVTLFSLGLLALLFFRRRSTSFTAAV